MDLPKPFSLSEIAAIAGGQVGAGGDTQVKSVALSPAHAKEGDLAIVFEPKLLAKIDECKASGVVIPTGTPCKLPHIYVDRPQVALARMLGAMQPPRFIATTSTVHPTAVVDPSAQIGEGVAIGPLCYVGPGTKIGARTMIGAGVKIGGKVTIGEDCLIHQGSLIADYVKVGNRVILQQGASLGSDGFGYVTERPSNMELRQYGDLNVELSDEPNPLLKIPQIGTVIVEDDVEIGSNACVDRATMGATVIGAGTKIDNLVMIAHNNRIGRECIIVAGSSVAGSCVLEDRVVMAGCSGTKDHLRVGKDAMILAQAGAMVDVPPGGVVVGTPAVPVKDKFMQVAHTKKLPQYAKELKELRRKVDQLEKALGERQLEAAGSNK